MSIIVQKYGGSSLATIEKIDALAASIARRSKSDEELVLVVSAMGDTTDQLIKMAHSLGLKVVAEGVETEEQSALLHALGCDEMQGYLLGRPAPSELFELTYLAPVALA